MSDAIKIKIGSRQQLNINVSDRPNSHYITTQDFEKYKELVSSKYITEEMFNERINSLVLDLDIPKKLTDLDIDLNLVKYDPGKDYLEVVEH